MQFTESVHAAPAVPVPPAVVQVKQGVPPQLEGPPHFGEVLAQSAARVHELEATHEVPLQTAPVPQMDPGQQG